MKKIISLIALALAAIPVTATSGILDDSFGKNGTIITDLNGLTDVGKSLIIDHNQKILISGSTATINPSQRFFALTRYNADGSLDKSFDQDGKVTTQQLGSEQTVNGDIDGLGLQESGAIVAVGRGYFHGKHGMVLVRYTNDGSIDRTFGQLGASFLADGRGEFHPLALTVDRDQNIVVAGALHVDNENSSFIAVRFGKDGAFDHTFGDDGYVITTVTPYGHNVIRAVKVDSKGRIVVGGFNGKIQFAVARYLPSGAVDQSFGEDGVATITFNRHGADTLNALVIQSDDKIIVGGGVQVDGVGGIRMIDFGLARLSTDGNLDQTFNKTGTLIIDFVYRAASCLWALALDAQENIIAVGDSMAVKGLAIARIHPNGTLDDSFGDRGKQTAPFGQTCHWEGVALQADGKIVAGGYVWNGKHYDLGLARLVN